MRSLPTDIALEIAKDYAFFCRLVKMELSTTVYYTDLDMDIVWNGNTYLSRGLKFHDVHGGLTASIDKTSFEIDNTGLEMSSLVLSQDTRGRVCTIYIAAIDKSGQVVDADVLFTGMLDSIKVDAKKAVFDVYSHMILWKKKIPGRIHQATCPWIFKDTTTCRYSSSAVWCDHSYDRCTALSNTSNFGGFRWLPSLQNKQVWWGRAG